MIINDVFPRTSENVSFLRQVQNLYNDIQFLSRWMKTKASLRITYVPEVNPFDVCVDQSYPVIREEVRATAKASRGGRTPRPTEVPDCPEPIEGRKRWSVRFGLRVLMLRISWLYLSRHMAGCTLL